MSKSPRLVLRFAAYTAAALVVAGGAILWFVHVDAVDRARDAAALHARYVADAVLRERLRPSDVDGTLTPTRRRALDEFFRSAVLVEGVHAARIHGRMGSAYASDGRDDAASALVRAALAGEDRQETTVEPEPRRKVLTTYVPLRFAAGERPAAAVELRQDFAPIERAAREAVFPVAVALALALLGLYASLFPILRRATAELERRNRELALQAVELQQTLAERERAEAALGESEAQMRQSQKMEAIGRLAGGLAHDMNNLLLVISGHAGFLLAGTRAPEDAQRDVTEIQRAAERAASLTRQLLAFSRQQVLVPELLDVNTVIEETSQMLHRLIGEHIEVVAKLDPQRPAVVADAGQLAQVLMNLLVNARDAIGDQGQIEISSSRLELAAGNRRALEPGTYVRIAVADDGAGMAEDVLAHIFEPFFTTKRAGEGTGLGLATAYGIVTQSGGLVSAESQPGVGSRFEVLLPAAEPAIVAAVEEAIAAEAFGPLTGRVLLVEDQPTVRAIAAEMLVAAGFEVVSAGDGVEALAVVDGEPIDVVVSDLVMPRMGGRELAARVRTQRPEVGIVLASGYSEDWSDTAQAEVIFLQKPFTAIQLIEAVRAALSPVRLAPTGRS